MGTLHFGITTHAMIQDAILRVPPTVTDTTSIISNNNNELLQTNLINQSGLESSFGFAVKTFDYS